MKELLVEPVNNDGSIKTRGCQILAVRGETSTSDCSNVVTGNLCS